MIHQLPRFIIAVVLAVSILRAVPAGAQAPGMLNGQVVDETGGALPGATVTVRDAGAGRERSTVTDAAGRFSIASQITEHEYTGRTFMFGISARFGR